MYLPKQQSNRTYRGSQTTTDQPISRPQTTTDTLRPNCIVALGRHPMFILTGKEGITKQWGFILPCTLVPGLKVIPIAHPAFIMRGMFALRQVMAVFLRRAIEESQTPEINLPQRELVIDPDPDTILYHLDRLRGSPKIAFDIENPAVVPSSVYPSPIQKNGQCLYPSPRAVATVGIVILSRRYG